MSGLNNPNPMPNTTSVQLSKPSDTTYSARPVGQPGHGHRLPQPGQLTIRDELLCNHINNNNNVMLVWQRITYKTMTPVYRACLDQRLIAIRSQWILRDNVRSKIWVITINYAFWVSSTASLAASVPATADAAVVNCVGRPPAKDATA